MATLCTAPTMPKKYFEVHFRGVAIVEEAMSMEDSARVTFYRDALQQLAGDGAGEDYAALYLELAEQRPDDPLLLWQASQLGFLSAAVPMITEGLTALSADAPAVEAHLLAFKAAAAGEERGVDLKLRELASRSAEAAPWQQVRFAQSGKWRNIQQGGKSKHSHAHHSSLP